MKRLVPLLLCGTLLAANPAVAGQASALPTNAPVSITLRDQYDAPQTLSFPAPKITPLVLADRKGAEAVAGWLTALKPDYGGRVDFRGLADLRGVPGFLHERIRKKFQEHYRYPLMLDWSGTNCDRFGFQHDVANVLLLDRTGRIGARFQGPASEASLKAVRKALDKLLSGEVQTAPR